MAMTMKAEGMEEISRMLTQMGDKAEGAAAGGLYEGAGTMADRIRQAAGNIRAEKFHYAVFPGAMTRLPSQEEKDAVTGAGLGIAKFDKNGTEVETSVGYGSNSGYVEIDGKQKAVALIANAINSGTSFMHKQPFFRKGVSSGTEAAEQKIIAEIERRFNEITGGQ